MCAFGRFRFIEAIASAALNALLLAVLLTSLVVNGRRPENDALNDALIDVELSTPPPPPPPVPKVPQHKHRPANRSGGGSPGHSLAQAGHSDIPIPKIPIAIPTFPPAGGNGGAGNGSGSGNGNGTGDGSGAGTGDGGSDAEWISGKIGNSDYPDAAAQRGAQGVVRAEITVAADGRVSACRVTGSSGDPDLDATTCRLIRQRFRFRPATDDAGHAIADTVEYEQEWQLHRFGQAERSN